MDLHEKIITNDSSYIDRLLETSEGKKAYDLACKLSDHCRTHNIRKDIIMDGVAWSARSALACLSKSSFDKMKIYDYFVLIEPKLNMEKAIKKHIDMGWQPLGGITHIPQSNKNIVMFAQAMVKHENY